MNELIYIAILVILFLVIKKTLENANLFGNGNTLLAVCVTLLCVIGMHKTFTPNEAIEEGSGFDYILLPYAALGVSILLILLFMWLSRLSKGNDDDCWKGKSGRTEKHLEDNDDNERLRR